MPETLLGSMKEKIKTSLSPLGVVFDLWRLNRKLDKVVGGIDKTDYVNLGAARQLMNHPEVIKVADQIQSFNGSADEAHQYTKTVMSRLSPAQQRALIMVQVERLNKLLSPSS